MSPVGHESCHRRRPRSHARKKSRSSKISSTVCSMLPIPGPKYVSKISRAVAFGGFQKKGKISLCLFFRLNFIESTEGILSGP